MVRKNPLLVLLLLLVSCNQPPANCDRPLIRPIPEPKEEIHNVILMIGDGMGLAQINAARLKARAQNRALIIDSLPVSGLVMTYSANHLITDSAAAATALATGHKTRNKHISVTSEGKHLKTILEAAEEKGLSTGLVVTSDITHATPAAFAAHVKHRNQKTKIAEQLLENGIDILLGGGRGYFLPVMNNLSFRSDRRNLIEKARNAGYATPENRNELLSTHSNKILGLFARDGLNFTENEPSLAEMTRVALDRLSRNAKGFIVMIEGSQIDWAAHHKDEEETIRQTLLFDDAVKVALDFAITDGHTLLIVTADHETGGMAIEDGHLDGSNLKIDWTTKHHTAIDVPVFSYGPGSFSLTGKMDNTELPKRIAAWLNLKLQ